jgi:hypothetical protein
MTASFGRPGPSCQGTPTLLDDLSDHPPQEPPSTPASSFCVGPSRDRIPSSPGENLAPVVGKGSERVLRRLLLRYLKGDALKAAKAMLRFVGVKFARVGVLKLVPFVNVPIGVAIAEMTTRRSARKARKFSALLPPGDRVA